MALLKAPESLATARLQLRRPQADDVEAVFRRYAADPKVTKYLTWPTHRSLAHTHAFLELSNAEWADWSAGAYLVFSRAEGTLLGGTGLSFETATDAVTGYVLAQDAWGKGYATEALIAMVELAATLGVKRLTAGCHPDNRASQRVLDKGGFRQESREHRTSGFPNLALPETQDILLFARIFSGGEVGIRGLAAP